MPCLAAVALDAMITYALVIVALAGLLVWTWLARAAMKARRQGMIEGLKDAAAELRAAENREAVGVVMEGVQRRGAPRGAGLDVLHMMAALALDRIRLSEEIAQQGEERFSALAEQTADVILIVDDDNRIRYASPSARDVFGTAILRNVALPDLVDPAERRSAEYLLRHARQSDQTGGVRAEQ